MSDSKLIGVDVSHWNTYKEKNKSHYMPYRHLTL